MAGSEEEVAIALQIMERVTGNRRVSREIALRAKDSTGGLEAVYGR